MWQFSAPWNENIFFDMTKNSQRNANKNLFDTGIRAKGVLPFSCFVCGCSGRKRS